MKKFLSRISISRVLISIIFSIALFCMNKIVFLGQVWEENYMELMFLSELKVFLLLIPLIYTFLYFVEKYYKKIVDIVVIKEEYKNKRKFCIATFVFLLTIFLVYYFSLYPGGVYIDTINSYQMLGENETISAHHPVLYTLSLNIVRIFHPNLVLGFGVFSFIQVVLMVIVLTYFIYWLLKRKVNPLIAVAITLFLGFFKLYPLYSISIWKDTPFSLILFLYILTLIDLLYNFNEHKIEVKNIIKFSIYTLLVIFLRNNGKFIAIGTILVLFFTYIKGLKKTSYILNIKKFYIINISVIIIAFFIESLYPVLGIEKTEFIESIGIPIQQIARVVATDGNITESQMELIEKIIPKEIIKEKYRAMLADKIKWDDSFNQQYLEENKSEYLKLWFELLIQNPAEYIRAYLLQTSGFWSFNVKGDEAYASAVTWESINDKVPNTDLIAKNFNISFSEDLVKVSYYSGGFFFWITILSMFITFRIGNKKSLIGYVPAIILWATIMIATPMAQALRYVYILVLILPLNLLYPAIVSTNINEQK